MNESSRSATLNPLQRLLDALEPAIHYEGVIVSLSAKDRKQVSDAIKELRSSPSEMGRKDQDGQALQDVSGNPAASNASPAGPVSSPSANAETNRPASLAECLYVIRARLSEHLSPVPQAETKK